MTQLFNNLNLSLKIAEYLLEPAILIIDHKYDKLNNLTIIIDKNFTNSQITYYIEYLYHKFTINYFIDKIKKNNENILCSLIFEVLNLNAFMKIVKHQVYIKNNYLKIYMPNTLLNLNILNSEYVISSLNLSLNENKYYNIKKLEYTFNKYILDTKIKNLQINMRYWGLYFSQYLEIINNDLSLFSVQELLNFIEDEELMMYELLNNIESDDEEL